MFEVVGFYKFVKISYLKKNQKVLLETLKKKNIRGTIIISKEGVNGTISGKAADIKFIINNLKRTLKFKEFNTSNVSKSSFQPFHKPKVKIKNEVVPMNLILNKRIKKTDRRIIAIGTTSVRALESCYSHEINDFIPIAKYVDLVIKPGYKFKVVDGLLTNFHLPKSSLLLLVSAMIGRERLLDLYKKAIKEKFRFFSYGDAMYISPD